MANFMLISSILLYATVYAAAAPPAGNVFEDIAHTVEDTVGDVADAASDAADTVSDAVDDAVDFVEDGIELIERTIDEWLHYFENHLAEFGLFYDEAEKALRLDIFKDNVNAIETANAVAALTQDPAPMIVNEFATKLLEEIWTGGEESDEMEALRRRNQKDRRRAVSPTATVDEYGHKAQEPPTEWNWRSHQNGIAVRSVKTQHCNNCWAHAAVAALETRNYVKNCMASDLSVNMVADCQYEPTRGDHQGDRTGCQVGWEWKPWQLAKDSGIPTTSDYMSELFVDVNSEPSFQSLFGSNEADGECRIDVDESPLAHPGVRTNPDTPYFKLQSFDELKFEVFNEGACTVGFGVDQRMQFYAANTVFEPQLSTNHIVTLVGYGYDDLGREYMVCKNSWGSMWGDEGYFKMLATPELWASGNIRVYCPIVEETGQCNACSDGEKVDNPNLISTETVNPPENARTYSTVLGDSNPGFNHGASMLDSHNAWLPNDDSKKLDHHLILDLGRDYYVGGLITQGRPDEDQWTTFYNVSVSNDGVTYRSLYNGEHGNYFMGNTDRDTKVTNMWAVHADEEGKYKPFDEELLFRYIKVTPLDWNNWPALRVAAVVYQRAGCFCAGEVCPFGTVCSFEKGCVAPAPGPTILPASSSPQPVPSDGTTVTVDGQTIHIDVDVNVHQEEAHQAAGGVNFGVNTPFFGFNLAGANNAEQAAGNWLNDAFKVEHALGVPFVPYVPGGSTNPNDQAAGINFGVNTPFFGFNLAGDNAEQAAGVDFGANLFGIPLIQVNAGANQPTDQAAGINLGVNTPFFGFNLAGANNAEQAAGSLIPFIPFLPGGSTNPADQAAGINFGFNTPFFGLNMGGADNAEEAAGINFGINTPIFSTSLDFGGASLNHLEGVSPAGLEALGVSTDQAAGINFGVNTPFFGFNMAGADNAEQAAGINFGVNTPFFGFNLAGADNAEQAAGVGFGANLFGIPLIQVNAGANQPTDQAAGINFGVNTPFFGFNLAGDNNAEQAAGLGGGASMFGIPIFSFNAGANQPTDQAAGLNFGVNTPFFGFNLAGANNAEQAAGVNFGVNTPFFGFNLAGANNAEQAAGINFGVNTPFFGFNLAGANNAEQAAGNWLNDAFKVEHALGVPFVPYAGTTQEQAAGINFGINTPFFGLNLAGADQPTEQAAGSWLSNAMAIYHVAQLAQQAAGTTQEHAAGLNFGINTPFFGLNLAGADQSTEQAAGSWLSNAMAIAHVAQLAQQAAGTTQDQAAGLNFGINTPFFGLNLAGADQPTEPAAGDWLSFVEAIGKGMDVGGSNQEQAAGSWFQSAMAISQLAQLAQQAAGNTEQAAGINFGINTPFFGLNLAGANQPSEPAAGDWLSFVEAIGKGMDAGGSNQEQAAGSWFQSAMAIAQLAQQAAGTTQDQAAGINFGINTPFFGLNLAGADQPAEQAAGDWLSTIGKAVLEVTGANQEQAAGSWMSNAAALMRLATLAQQANAAGTTQEQAAQPGGMFIDWNKILGPGVDTPMGPWAGSTDQAAGINFGINTPFFGFNMAGASQPTASQAAPAGWLNDPFANLDLYGRVNGGINGFNLGLAGAAQPNQQDAPTNEQESKSSWDTWGPISAAITVLLGGCFAGVLAARCIASRKSTTNQELRQPLQATTAPAVVVATRSPRDDLSVA